MPIRKFSWVLILMPISTLVVLLILLQSPEAITAIVPGPLGKVVILSVGVVLLATDVGAIVILSRQFRQERERQIQSLTGRDVEEWVELVAAQGPRDRSESVAWLGAQYGLSEREAGYIQAEKERRDRIAEGGMGIDRRMIVLGCSIALILLILGMVWGMMVLLRGM